jgi:hypothetical protein
LNRRDHFWNGAQLAEFVDTIGCQNCLVIHIFLTDTDPAQLVTNDPDILFSGLHNGGVHFFYDTIKRCLRKIPETCNFKNLAKHSLQRYPGAVKGKEEISDMHSPGTA